MTDKGAGELDHSGIGGHVLKTGNALGSESAGVLAADLKRKELANFLRARREAISPEDVGLPRLRRRRTPGLRREEVAFMSGIGAAWYARLEMGHDITPSSETLLAVATSLKLNAIETEYVFELAGLGIPQFHEVARRHGTGALGAAHPRYCERRRGSDRPLSDALCAGMRSHAAIFGLTSRPAQRAQPRRAAAGRPEIERERSARISNDSPPAQWQCSGART